MMKIKILTLGLLLSTQGFSETFDELLKDHKTPIPVPRQLDDFGNPISPEVFEIVNGSEISYEPFQIKDLCRKMEGSTCVEFHKAANEVFTGSEKFVGTVGEYVDYLNKMEMVYNKAGQTLRDPGDEILKPLNIPTNKKELKKVVLENLRIQTESFLDEVVNLDPLVRCPLLPEPKLPELPAELRADGFPKVNVGRFVDMPVDQVVKRINEGQQVLCSLGINLFANIDYNPKAEILDLVQEIVNEMEDLLLEKGIMGYANAFSPETVSDITESIDIAKDIEKAIKNKSYESPEALLELSKKYGGSALEDVEIPNIPNISAPTPPKRRELKVKKKKDWQGFNHGKRSRIATYANAYLEISGSEDVQEATAFGAAGVYILNNEINVIGGYGIAYAGPEEVSVEMKVTSFGIDVFDPIRYEDKTTIVKKDDKAWGTSFKYEYSQTFMAGPVPVTVAVGAVAGIGIGYEYGLYKTQIKGGFIPYAIAEGFARGSAGIPGILSVGAAASVTIVDIKAPLTGFAGIKFDEVGYPALKINIESRINYRLLDGRIYAYAEYIVPKFGIPPWKSKTAEYDIFQWSGIKGSLLVMNWGLELGRNGSKLDGDLLDQSDRLESQAFDLAITIDQRKAAIFKLNQQLRQKAKDMFLKINEDLTPDKNKVISDFAGVIPTNLIKSEKAFDVYKTKINELLSRRIDDVS